jgi:hypothetical protein
MTAIRSAFTVQVLRLGMTTSFLGAVNGAGENLSRLHRRQRLNRSRT